MRDRHNRQHDAKGRYESKRQSEYDGESLAPPAPRANLVSVDAGDDAAHEALRDISAVVTAHEGTCVIGGHMVSLFTTAFPTEHLIPRRTGDADAGIPVSLAGDSSVRQGLIDLGYVSKNNRYTKPSASGVSPTIDLLVPSYDGKFGATEQDSLPIDKMPGLGFALARTITIEVSVSMSDGSENEFSSAVPSIEGAVVLKAYAWRSRRFSTSKDMVDLSNLLQVLDQHDPHKLGGWRLDESATGGARRDAAQILHQMGDLLDSGRVRNSGVNSRRLVALIRRHVGTPS